MGPKYDNRKHFSASWNVNGQIQITVRINYKKWTTTYTMPECTGGASCIPALRWVHASAVWNKIDLKLYINGALEVTDGGTVASSLSSVTNTFSLDHLLITRDVRIWDYILSSNDLMIVYNKSE